MLCSAALALSVAAEPALAMDTTARGLAAKAAGQSTVAALRASRYNALAAAGDSWIAGVGSGSTANIYTKALGRSYAFRSLGNFAVAGTRSDQIYSQLPSVCASGAKAALVDQGINDVAQSVSEQTLEANEIKNWNYLIACGVEPIDMGMPPTNTGGNVAPYLANEIWRSIYTYKKGIRHIDVWSPLATNTGAFQTGVFQDAVHYNTVGADIVADVFSAVLTGAAPSRPPLLAMTDTSAANASFINNAVSFGGAGATSLPTGWFAVNGGCASYAVTAATTADVGQPGGGAAFGNWMSCTLSGAVSNTGFQAQAVTIASLGWNVGDTVAYGFCIKWSDSGQSLTVTVANSSFSGQTAMFQEKGGASGEAKCVYVENTIPVGATSTTMIFEATGTGTFSVLRPTMVNLTKLGQYNSLIGY